MKLARLRKARVDVGGPHLRGMWVVCRSSEQPGPSTGTHGLEEKPTPRLRTRPADALTSACGAQARGPSPTELQASEPPLFKAAPFGVTYYAAIENDNTFVKYFGAPTMRRSLLGAGDAAMGKTETVPVPMGSIFQSES